MFTDSTTPTTTWNGPICTICAARYLGAHTCTREDIVRGVMVLLDQLSDMSPAKVGCTLSGPQVTR